MKDIIKQITQIDDKVAYAKTKEIVAESEISKKYYKYLDDFASLLNEKNIYSYTRIYIVL